MLNRLPLSLEALLNRLVDLLPEDADLYLVGGAVRDMLCDRPVHDLDLVMAGDVLLSARRLADAVGGAYYPLDEERQTARLILQPAEEPRLVVDIAGWRGADLEADLRGRDFTINAMALSLRSPDELIDPLGGVRDLHEKILRACSAESMRADPVRAVRAVRLAIQHKMRIEPQTLTWIRDAAPLLPRVSAERKRDELFRILEGSDAATAIRILDRLGILPYLLPELEGLKEIAQSPPHIYDVWDHTLETAARLSTVLDILSPGYHPDQGTNLAVGLVSLRLGRYRDQIKAHLTESFTPERTVRPLLLLAALYHDIAKQHTGQIDDTGRIRFFRHDQLGSKIVSTRAAELRLSQDEIERVKRVVRTHMRPMLLAQAGGMPSRRAVYRFFRDTGKAGVDVCLLSMADFLGAFGTAPPQETWTHHLDVIRTLLEAWWEKTETAVLPKPLINGHQLIEQLGLSPGPQIGSLLEVIREAQACGEVSTPEQALQLAGKIVRGEYDDPLE